VSLASFRAQSADPKRLFETSACPAAAVGICTYLYVMYDKIMSYLYAKYGNFAYDLYGLYDSLGPKKRSKSRLNHYGSNGYV
jgi:hypothetical protein